MSSYRWIGNRLIEVSTANLTDESGVVELKQRLLIDTEGRVLRDMLRAALRDNPMRETLHVATSAYMRILEVLDKAGEDLVIESNDRSRFGMDAYRFNPRTSSRTLLTGDSPGNVREFVADHEGQVRIAVTVNRGEEKTALWYRKSNDDRWTKLAESAYEDDEIRPIAFDYDNKTLYVSARSKEAGKRFGVYAFDPDVNKLGALIYENASVDANRLVFDRSTKKVVGIPDDSADAVHWVDPQWIAIQKSIDTALPGMRNHLSWGRDATDRIVVASESDSTSPAYFVLDRKTGRLEELVVSRPWLEKVALAPRRFVRYTARDGLSIPGFLTLPKGVEARKLPLVVMIHGGPYVQAQGAGYDDFAQFLASRGYAVLEPHFRGTLGYGDAFYKAGWRQWGLAMQDDVTDGVRWLIDSGRVDADRVCLLGASYGGYATLWGLAKEPKMFRCGVAYVAVSDLEMMFDVGWSDFMRAERGGDMTRTFARWIGDPATDRDKMRAVSPLHHADRIQAPLLLAYGASDTRVPLIHGDRMRSALDKYNKPYEWVVYNDEWHGFNKDENRYDFYRRVDAFLAKNLVSRATSVSQADPEEVRTRAMTVDVAATSALELSFAHERLDLSLIHRFLSGEAYWSPGIPRDVVERAVANSLCIGAYRDGRQVGFARLVTDRATFAYLADVFVVAAERGAGIGRQMVLALLDHDDAQGLRRVLLFTADAHAVYTPLGFRAIGRPERGMEILRTDPYSAPSLPRP